MSQIEKLIEKLLNSPRGFRYSDLQKIMVHFGYLEDSAGKTSGSVVSFVNANRSITIYKPHPESKMQLWAVKKVIVFLKEEGELL